MGADLSVLEARLFRLKKKSVLMEMSLSFKPELCNYDEALIGAGQLLCQCRY